MKIGVHLEDVYKSLRDIHKLYNNIGFLKYLGSGYKFDSRKKRHYTTQKVYGLY